MSDRPGNDERRPLSKGGAQRRTECPNTTPSVIERTFNCQEWQTLAAVLMDAWVDSDRLWRTVASPLAYKLTCDLHAAARLAHRLARQVRAAQESEAAS